MLSLIFIYFLRFIVIVMMILLVSTVILTISAFRQILRENSKPVQPTTEAAVSAEIATSEQNGADYRGFLVGVPLSTLLVIVAILNSMLAGFSKDKIFIDKYSFLSCLLLVIAAWAYRIIIIYVLEKTSFKKD